MLADPHRLLTARAGAHQVLRAPEVCEREDRPEVRHPGQRREVPGQRDRLRVGVREDRHWPHIAEVELPYVHLPVRLQLVDLDESAVDVQRDRIGHRMDAVLDDRGAFLRLAAVDVHDVDAADLVEKLLGAQPGEHVGQPGGVAHPDQSGHPGRPGSRVHVKHDPGGREVVADVDVVHAGRNRGLQNGRPEAVEGPDAVEHHIRALHRAAPAKPRRWRPHRWSSHRNDPASPLTRRASRRRRRRAGSRRCPPWSPAHGRPRSRCRRRPRVPLCGSSTDLLTAPAGQALGQNLPTGRGWSPA